MNPASKTAEPVRQYQRRRYFIKKPFQTRFILQFSALILLGIFSFGTAIYLHSQNTLTTAFVNSRLRVMSTAEFLLPALGLIALVVSGLVTVAAAVRLLLFSHKIAGPLYRLETTAKQVEAGDLSLRVRLRSQDELQDVAVAMDHMVSELRSRMQKIKYEITRLGSLSQPAARDLQARPELYEVLGDIQHKLEEQVRQFRV
jgi:methyl-accepting chemotaxis protein